MRVQKDTAVTILIEDFKHFAGQNKTDYVQSNAHFSSWPNTRWSNSSISTAITVGWMPRRLVLSFLHSQKLVAIDNTIS